MKDISIKAKNLRIGNVLQDPEGNFVEVIRLHENGTIEVHSDIHQFHDFNDKDEPFFKPVALSDELLDRCALPKDIQYKDQWNEKTVFWCNGLQFEKVFDGRYIIHLKTFIGFKRIDFLHDIQNIVFALTDDEINTKLLFK